RPALAIQVPGADRGDGGGTRRTRDLAPAARRWLTGARQTPAAAGADPGQALQRIFGHPGSAMSHYLWEMRPYFRQVAGQFVLGSLCGIVMNTAIVLPAL